MRIVVTSDLHKRKDLINYILYNYEADYYYDCGDSQLLNSDLKNFYSVQGNCDHEIYPSYRIINISNKYNIFITHGHLYTEDQLIKVAKSKNCNIIIHGHTHVKKYEEKENIIILNPGSITKPRSIDSNTFLIIDYNELEDEIKFDFIKITL